MSIFAVTFFGILTFAFAEYPPDTTACLNLEDYEGFDSTQFSKGTWYVTHARYGSNSTICREYKIRPRNSGSIHVVADGYYDYGDKPRFYRVRCEGSKTKINKGKFSLNCRQRSRGRENKIVFDYQLEMTVVETNYNNFAVLYRCGTYLAKDGSSFIEDNLLILHRKKDGKHPTVVNLLKQYDSSLDIFLSREDNQCLPSPVQDMKKKTK